MNFQRGTVIVVSKDGITFSVETDRISAAFEQAFAKHRTADELRAHGDFTEVKSLDDLIKPDAPVKARPKLTLIQGGKS